MLHSWIGLLILAVYLISVVKVVYDGSVDGVRFKGRPILM